MVNCGPFLDVEGGVDGHLSNKGRLSFLRQAATRLSVAKDCRGHVERVRTYRFGYHHYPLGDDFNARAAVERLVRAKGNDFLLSFRDFRLLAHDLVVHGGLFGLSEDHYVSFRRVFVSFPIFLRFDRTRFSFDGENVVSKYDNLYDVRHNVGCYNANLHVLRYNFNFRCPSFVFAVIRRRRDVPFVCLLVLNGMGLVGVSQDARISEQCVLLSLNVITNFHLTVVRGRAGRFGCSPSGGDRSWGTSYGLPAAGFLRFLHFLLVDDKEGVVFRYFRVL